MDNCDVLIVGGGPAGSTCARKLVQAGLDVVIMDKRTFPREKVCAGWITPAVVEELELDPEHYTAGGRTFQPLTGFRTGIQGAAAARTDYGRAVSYGIRRYEFDDYLLARCGARQRLGEAVKTLRRDGDGWVVNEAIHAPMLVGAGGHFCPIARHLGARPGSSEPIVAAKEIEFPMDETQKAQCPIDPEVPELLFCSDLKGYGWVFRKGDYLNIGLGRQDNHGLTGHLQAFVQGLRQAGRLPPGLPERYQGHAYLLYGDAPRPLLDHGVVVIGDAAGLAYAQSGEGIRPAVESALMAAYTIQAAAGDYRRNRLEPYATLLSQRFGAREKRHVLPINKALPKGLIQFLGRRMLSSPWFSRHLVLDRWFFHAHQAPLRL